MLRARTLQRSILSKSLAYVPALQQRSPRLYSIATATAVNAKPAEKSLLNPEKFIGEMCFIKGTHPLKAYRVMDHSGNLLNESDDPKMDKDQVVNLYKKMVQLNVMDGIMYDAQRQGRISFYMTHYGEEAMIGIAAALDPEDVVFGQYREAYMLLYRGLTVDECVSQCFGNDLDMNKGRQMPVHYGSKKHNFQTISSPLATQIPQAAGSAYALKMAGNRNISVCFFGEGAASEGDFHAGLNMAATLSCPVIFVCRNNGYAISTPSSEQYKGDGIASRGVGYGIDTIRIDGNDIWACYNATKKAREMAVQSNKPVLIEAMTYRAGHHSTSDDSTKYRNKKEVAEIIQNDNPITRLRHYIENHGWWSQEDEDECRKQARKTVLDSFASAEKRKKPALENLFTDVYDELTPNLEAQKKELKELIAKYPEYYPTDEFKSSI